jgi:hypothetical protein
MGKTVGWLQRGVDPGWVHRRARDSTGGASDQSDNLTAAVANAPQPRSQSEHKQHTARSAMAGSFPNEKGCAVQ